MLRLLGLLQNGLNVVAVRRFAIRSLSSARKRSRRSAICDHVLSCSDYWMGPAKKLKQWQSWTQHHMAPDCGWTKCFEEDGRACGKHEVDRAAGEVTSPILPTMPRRHRCNEPAKRATRLNKDITRW